MRRACKLCGISYTTENPKLAELSVCPKCFSNISEAELKPSMWKAPDWTSRIPEKAVIQEGKNSLVLTGKVEVGPNPRNPDRVRAIVYTKQGLFYTGSLALMVALKEAAKQRSLEGRRLCFDAAGEGVARRYSNIRVE